MKPLSIAAALIPLTLGGAAPALAGSGCVGQVLLPPTETTTHERVLEAPARVERSYIPAEVRHTGHRVLVRVARETRVRLPALYRTWHGYASAPGPMRYEHTAPTYATVQDKVLLQPGHYVWRRQYGPLVPGGPPLPGQTQVTPTGEIMCRVWCPAQYGYAPRQVMIAPGHRIAVRTTVQRPITREVLVRPATVQVRRTPAQYRWVSQSHVIAPGHWDVRRTAAVYGWRDRRETHDGGRGWAPVVCGGPLSRPALARMQGALAAQGYDAGPPDGQERPQTYEALRRYQVDHRMPAGQVTVDSARALGVVP